MPTLAISIAFTLHYLTLTIATIIISEEEIILSFNNRCAFKCFLFIFLIFFLLLFFYCYYFWCYYYYFLDNFFCFFLLFLLLFFLHYHFFCPFSFLHIINFFFSLFLRIPYLLLLPKPNLPVPHLMWSKTPHLPCRVLYLIQGQRWWPFRGVRGHRRSVGGNIGPWPETAGALNPLLR